MKKIFLAFLALVIVAGGGLFAYQNRPSKQFSRHLIKARLFVRQGNYTQALKEYESAYNATGTFTPYVSIEVLKLSNQIAFENKKFEVAMQNTQNLLKVSPGSKEGRLILAKLGFQIGQLEPAFEALNSLLVDDANNYEGRLLLAQVRTRQGQVDLAEEQLRTLVAIHPDSHDVVLPLVQNLMSQGKHAEARTLLLTLLVQNPNDTVAHLLVVEGWLKERQVDSAARALDAWLAIDSSVSQPIAIQKSRIESMRGNHLKALEALAPFVEETKTAIPVLSEVALIHVKMGHLDSALKKYDAIIDQKPNSRGSYLLLTHLIQLAAKNPVRALEILKTLEVGVRDRVFQRSLIATYLSIGQENKIDALLASEPDSSRPALEAFRKGLIASPDFVGGWALYNYYEMNEQPYWMLKTLDSLYKKWPANPLIARSYAGQLIKVRALKNGFEVLKTIKEPSGEDEIRMIEISRRLGQSADALKISLNLLKKYPQARGINAIISDLYLAGHENDKAIEYALKELNIDKDNIVCINNLAWIYGVIKKDMDKAKPYLDQLEKVKNIDPRVLDTIGWILANSDRVGDADPYFKLAVNILPNNSSLLYHYGWQQFKKGDKAHAAELIKKSLSLNRPFPEKADAEKLLSELI